MLPTQTLAPPPVNPDGSTSITSTSTTQSHPSTPPALSPTSSEVPLTIPSAPIQTMPSIMPLPSQLADAPPASSSPSPSSAPPAPPQSTGTTTTTTTTPTQPSSSQIPPPLQSTGTTATTSSPPSMIPPQTTADAIPSFSQYPQPQPQQSQPQPTQAPPQPAQYPPQSSTSVPSSVPSTTTTTPTTPTGAFTSTPSSTTSVPSATPTVSDTSAGQSQPQQQQQQSSVQSSLQPSPSPPTTTTQTASMSTESIPPPSFSQYPQQYPPQQYPSQYPQQQQQQPQQQQQSTPSVNPPVSTTTTPSYPPSSNPVPDQSAQQPQQQQQPQSQQPQQQQQQPPPSQNQFQAPDTLPPATTAPTSQNPSTATSVPPPQQYQQMQSHQPQQQHQQYPPQYPQQHQQQQHVPPPHSSTQPYQPSQVQQQPTSHPPMPYGNNKVPPPQFYRYNHPKTRYSLSNRDASVPFQQSQQICMTYYQAIEKNKKLPRNYRFAPVNTHHPLYTMIIQGQSPPKSVPIGANAPPSTTSGRSSGRVKNIDESLHTSTMISLCSELLASLVFNPAYQIFRTPVDPIAHGCPDYFDIVKEPMDLDTVHDRLSKGKYPTQYEFASDIRLVFTNAMMYNPPGHAVHELAKQALQSFEERFAQLGQQQVVYSNNVSMQQPSYHTGSSKARKSTGAKSKSSRKSTGGSKRSRKNDYDDDDDDDDDISDEMYYRYYGQTDPLAIPSSKSRQSQNASLQAQQQAQQQAYFWHMMSNMNNMNPLMMFPGGMPNPAAAAAAMSAYAMPQDGTMYDPQQLAAAAAAAAGMKKGGAKGMPQMAMPQRQNKKARTSAMPGADPSMMVMQPGSLVPQALHHRLSYDPVHTDHMMNTPQQPYPNPSDMSLSSYSTPGGLPPMNQPPMPHDQSVIAAQPTTDATGVSGGDPTPGGGAGGENDAITDEEIDALSSATQQLSEEQTYGLLEVLKFYIPDLDDSSDIDLGVLSRPHFLHIQSYVNNALSESSNREANQPLQSPNTMNHIPSRYNEPTMHSPQTWGGGGLGTDSDED